MKLRLMEIILPAIDAEDVLRLMGEQNLLNTWLGVWTETLEDGIARVRVLLPAQKTENVSDLLTDRFGTLETFRIILLPVEATVPQPEEPAGEDSETEKKESGRRSDRLSREELYADVSEGANLTSVYAVTVVLSSVVAAIGLTRGNVAVIIGAMVMAPLIRPNMALALAATLGDLPLALRSARANIVGLLIGALLSALIGYWFPFDPRIPEIASRTTVGIGDVILALAAGSAGALSFSTGVSAALIGVMVAVALLPPLVVLGLLVGAGEWEKASGALVLTLMNLTCINLAAVATFLIQGIRPRSFWHAETAKKASWIAIAFWVSMLAVFIALILFWWGKRGP
jgi:uncharacterized hydrophobic protein (TIGR00341 family)